MLIDRNTHNPLLPVLQGEYAKYTTTTTTTTTTYTTYTTSKLSLWVLGFLECRLSFLKIVNLHPTLNLQKMGFQPTLGLISLSFLGLPLGVGFLERCLKVEYLGSQW